jgi:hypothetical protein
MSSFTALKKTGIILLALCFILFSAVNTEGAIRSVRSRTLSDPSVVTTQYAKIDPSNLLTQSILRVTIQNDNSGEAKMKIVLAIELETDDSSWNGTMQIDLLKTLAAGESFTVDNAKIIEDLDSFIDGGFSFGTFDSEFGPEERAATPEVSHPTPLTSAAISTSPPF